MSPDTLDIVWRCVDNLIPVLTAEEVETVPSGNLNSLTTLGILRQAATATHVTCDACAEGHVEQVMSVKYPAGVTRFYITCPENGRVEVSRDRLMQWSVDYLPILKAVASALSISAEPEESAPGRVWHLGRSTLAGKSRTVWVARGLARPDVMRIVDILPKGRSPVVFFLGQPPDNNVLQIPYESIINLRTVVRLSDDDLIIDMEAIESQLTSHIVELTKKKPKKRSSRTSAIDAIKEILREHLRTARDHAYTLRQHRKPAELLPRPSQKQLAKQIRVSVSSVSRAINDPSDKATKFLWELAVDIDRVMEFKG